MNVDVVVVSFQSADHLRECLEALPADVRVRVVDNASSDGSADVAGELGVEVTRNPDNRGFAAAANQGARIGTADSILFLNPDAVVAARDLRLLQGALDADPDLAIVGPRLLRSDGTEQRGWWPQPSSGETWREALGLRRLWPARLGPNGEAPFVVGACFLIRRSVFEALGGFDEAFWLYGEEADLCRRARDAGWRVRYVAQATARHVGGSSGVLDRSATFEHFQRGAELFIVKHQGASALVAHRLGVLVGAALRIPMLAVRPSGRVRSRLRAGSAARALRWLASHPTGVASGSPRERTRAPLTAIPAWRALRRARMRAYGLAGMLRARLLAWTHPGVRVGRGVRVRAGCRFILEPSATLHLADRCEIDTGTTVAVYGSGTLNLGEGVFVGHHGTLAVHDSVTIGQGAFLAELVSVRDHDHAVGVAPSSGAVEVAPVSIGRDAWLGAKVTVLRGAQVGEGAVVAAHAVVRGVIPAGALAAGIPARVVRAEAAERPR